MNLSQFLSGPVAEALGWTLLHAVWQGFALVLPAALLLHHLRNRSSALRYQAGVLTLLTQVVASAATFVWCYRPALTAPMPQQLITQPVLIRWGTVQTMAQTLPWHQQVQQFLGNHLSQFVLVYLIGVALFGLRLVGGWVYLQRLSRSAIQPATSIWTELTASLRSTLDINTVVQVRESARIAVPMVVGILKPVLLLPVGLTTGLSMREIEAVLAHELAHVKRHDYAVNLLQSLVEVLYFFHPALWWLSARVREEREHCCDDLAVMACGGDGRILAQALARVEELRLAQTEAPALAMAFTGKRQLLQRVRRMLGVPTQPLVSNGNLAGLTLVTLLLVSASVYAVQQKQDEPKPRTTQPKPTRRHNVSPGVEFAVSDKQKVEYIIWKGHKLPASRVARLQRQYDQVMAGQLTLDNIPQADRDILLTLIETRHSFGEGMDELNKGLAQIDYNNIITTAFEAANDAGTFPVNVDGVLKEVKRIDYNGIIHNALGSVTALQPLSDTLDRLRALQQRRMDSLSQIMAQRAQQMQTLQLQMEKMRFPVEEVERSQEILEWRKEKLMEQRNALIEKHQRLLQGQQKLSQAEIEKQLQALQPEIRKQEASIEEMNQQLQSLQAKLESARQPLAKLEQEAEALQEQVGRLENQIDQHADAFAPVLPPDVPSRPARPSRVPRPPKAARPALPALPPPPAKANVHVAPVVPATPARPPRPATVPKVAPIPKPD
ncbi:M48 family metalloprotease [Spirosoma taeanense]|uniref:M48 family metalloprotease n=1 Tax=Spirosoma taeanense TaxID=2735870 RepID=A0A6M5YD11_9BACT|nr:M56 family metallopeptidase [Spirosoma taeanense]QJW91918.1 M48 family metalloprotease [Spirosoma taeanense]